MKLRLSFIFQPVLILYFSIMLSACSPTDFTVPVSEREPQHNEPQITVIAEDLFAPVGLALLPNGAIFVAEEGTGERDNSGGVSLIMPDGQVGRFVSGFSSSRDSGDLAGVNLVGIAPSQDKLYIGHFNDEQLLTISINPDELALPNVPFSPDQLSPAMIRLNNVYVINPFDITFDRHEKPVVSDATGNGAARENPDGTTHWESN